jgi:aromatic ring-opening dioxygenase LigB subunit
LASGDQSHSLTTDSPAGFQKEGKEYDEKIQELIQTENEAGLLQLDPQLVTRAAACSYHPLLLLAGVLEGLDYTPVIHSYEAPFGVGYLVAEFEMR